MIRVYPTENPALVFWHPRVPWDGRTAESSSQKERLGLRTERRVAKKKMELVQKTDTNIYIYIYTGSVKSSLKDSHVLGETFKGEKEPPLQTYWSAYTKVESLGPLHWRILPSEGPPNYMLYMVHTWKAKCSDTAGNFSHHLIRNAWNTPAEKYFLISCAIWRHYPRVIFVLFYSEVGLLEHSSWTCSDLN